MIGTLYPKVNCYSGAHSIDSCNSYDAAAKGENFYEKYYNQPIVCSSAAVTALAEAVVVQQDSDRSEVH